MTCCSTYRNWLPLMLGLTIVTVSLFAAGGASLSTQNEKLLRHVVMVKFKETSSKEDVSKVVDAFRGLPSKISEITSFEYGTDNSPEGLANGFTHCFLITFKTEKDREAYLPHKAHKAFVEMAMPHIDKVLVVDYWASK